jgi:pimeloyl-ACP methyl ester carboxylesterase
MSGYFRQDFLTAPDGASVFYQVEGDGEPGMVLCDGLGCDGFAWKYLQPYLKRRFRTLRWHYRGHGRSGLPRERERIGMTYTCDDLARVMDAAGMEKAVIFGHSMGVQVALEFHRRFASRVSGLVLICGAYGTPLDTWHGHDKLRRAFPYIRQVVERFPVGTRALTRALLSTELVMQLAITAEMNRDFIRPKDLVPYFAHLAKMDPVVFVRTLDSLATHTAWEHLPHVTVPSLVVGGDRDRFTPGKLSEDMARAIPGAELLMVRGGSHTTPLEHPDLLELRVERFLRERVLGPEQALVQRASEPPAA